MTDSGTPTPPPPPPAAAPPPPPPTAPVATAAAAPAPRKKASVLVIALISVVALVLVAGLGVATVWVLTSGQGPSTSQSSTKDDSPKDEDEDDDEDEDEEEEEEVDDDEDSTSTSTPEPPAATDAPVNFQSVSGNIGCSITKAAVVCHQNSIKYTAPSNACTTSIGGATVGVDRRSVFWPCVDASITGSVLEYDTPITAYDFTCSINYTTGVTCYNTDTRGFTMEYNSGISTF